jgi:LPS sulfotransferase NodH
MSDEIFRLFPDSAHAATITQAFAPGPLLSGDTTPLARRPILMVFTNRCGSTFIAAKLSEAGYVGPPTAHRNFEFFNADILIPWCRDRGIASLDAYLRAIAAEYAAPAGTFFSKISVDQLIWLTRCGVIGTLLPAPIFIHVVRRDVIAQAISLVIAVQTGEWTSLHQKNPVTPDFMPRAILNVAKDIRIQEAHADLYFSLTGAAVMRIVYEDAVADPTRIVAGFTAMAPIPPVPVNQPTLPVERQRGALNAEWERRFRAFVAGRMQV